MEQVKFWQRGDTFQIEGCGGLLEDRSDRLIDNVALHLLFALQKLVTGEVDKLVTGELDAGITEDLVGPHLGGIERMLAGYFEQEN
uniref:Uncharacterized protein n=1 Tax=Nymphaea colorata TaxID=210225 RepID=A0A5K0WWN0_9MAGN